jgi:hypothetical protein
MTVRLGSIGRVFSGDKVVDSKLFNVLGAQVFRTIAARSIYNARRADVSEPVRTKLDALGRDGIVVWPDFLPRDHFENVRRECFELAVSHDQILDRASGPTTIQALHVRKVEDRLQPNILKFLADRRLQELVEGAEKRSLGPLAKFAKIEHVTQGVPDKLEDPQSLHHSDTFFTCHKAWFYVSDVTMRDGPLTFIKGSHKLTPRRLQYIYQDSCTRTEESDPSRRVTADEMAEVRDRKMILTCPRNTLVIANVCGYHSRLQGEPGAERWAVQLGVRVDPFRGGTAKAN